MNFHASVLAGLYVAWFPCEIIRPGGQAMKWGHSPQPTALKVPPFYRTHKGPSGRTYIWIHGDLNWWSLELKESNIGLQRLWEDEKKVPFILSTKHSPADSGHSQGPELSTPLQTVDTETSGMVKWASFVCMPSTTSCNLAMPQFPPLRNEANNIPPESLWGVSEL